MHCKVCVSEAFQRLEPLAPRTEWGQIGLVRFFVTFPFGSLRRWFPIATRQ
jgi:hypothetical protein